MNRRLVIVALTALLVVVVAALTFWGISRVGTSDATAPADLDTTLREPLEAGEAILYFPGRGGRLYAERRALAAELGGEARLELIIEQLLLGPESERLSPVLPGEVELRDATLTADGTLFIDLGSKQGVLTGIGSTSELLAVYSLVDTALANEPGAQRVVLLWNGRQQPSLAGHVDTTRPLTADRRLIAENS